MKYRDGYNKLRNAAKIRDEKIRAEECFRKRLAIKEDVNSDSYIRKEIHATITRGITEGKNKEEIIKELSIERYDKYAIYFENWINDKLKKLRPESQIEER